MSYLLDRKIKKKKFIQGLLFVFIFLILFYFRLGIWNGLSYASHKFFRPILVFGNNIGDKLKVSRSYFVSKSSLFRDNEILQSRLDEKIREMSNYNSILAENISLKEILGRIGENESMVLAAILEKPNQSPYDTLVIDAGLRQGLFEGDVVFALGNIPIGRIANVYPNSSKVILFSSAQEKTEVMVGDKPASTSSSLGGNIFLEAIGRGGGNFEMVLPRDFTLVKGDQVILPGIFPYVLGIVETIISDPRDPFIKALLVSPVNIQELKFVQVRTSP